MKVAWLSHGIAASLAAACGPAVGETSIEASAKPVGSVTAPARAAPPPTAAPAIATSGAPVAPSPPPGRTALPTTDEWSAVTREVTVKGSSALSCETKMVREYLRIVCKGANDTGGTPLSVVRRKGGQDAVLVAGGGAMSVVLPYTEGTHATFVFAWTDKTHLLTLAWARGGKSMPAILGELEGAKSPLDGTSGDFAVLCAKCDKELAETHLGSALCEVITGNPWCLKTYNGDCSKLLECGFGAPSAMVTCPEGTAVFGTGHHCAKLCVDEICPPGSTCSSEVGSRPVCMED